MLVLWLACVVVLIAWLAAKDRRSRNYWKRRGVPQIEAASIFSLRSFLASFSPGLIKVCELYESSSEPLVGFYKGRSPVLLVRDPGLATAVLRTDFQHFADKRRPIRIDKGVDPLSQHLIGLTGEKWKSVRSKLTPVFSSGKVKESLPLIEEALTIFQGKLGEEPIDIYPATVPLVTDVILSYAFGLEADSEEERARVRWMGYRAIRSDPGVALRRALRFYFPRLFGLLGLRAFDPAVTGFFTGFIRDALTGRRRLPPRADFLIRLLSIASDLPEKEREGLLAAQAFSFFVAGFETTCLTLSMCLYELCKHPEVVAEARRRIDPLIQKHGRITYEVIKESPYITQIMKETMRLYTADYASYRICTKDYIFQELGVRVDEGTEVLIPGFCLARDAQYFREPLLFDPDRFSSDRKAEVVPGTYLPFGEGPRQCIAVRFSMLEVEYILAKLISEYDMELAPGSPNKVEFDPHSRVTHFKGKIFIKFRKR